MTVPIPYIQYEHLFYDDLYMNQADNGTTTCGTARLPFSVDLLKKPGVRIYTDSKKFGTLELNYRGSFRSMLLFSVSQPGYEHCDFRALPSRELILEWGRQYDRLYKARKRAAAGGGSKG